MDTGCRLENPPGAMDDKDDRQERVWEIYASGTTWWCWSIFLIIILSKLQRATKILKYFL